MNYTLRRGQLASSSVYGSAERSDSFRGHTFEGYAEVAGWREFPRDPLSHAARHEAPDRDLTVKQQRPNHRASRSVRFGDQGVVGNIDPIILKADPITAVFRFPIGVCDALTIRDRAAESSAALQIIEPLFKR